MALSVKLNVFEGPLDLLLHLIDKNKIDIYDIPIVEITDQYMEYLHSMEKEDLGIMSEFLVMAATLLDIKCKMLLPKDPVFGNKPLPHLQACPVIHRTYICTFYIPAASVQALL